MSTLSTIVRTQSNLAVFTRPGDKHLTNATYETRRQGTAGIAERGMGRVRGVPSR